MDNTYSAGVLLRCVRARRGRRDPGADQVHRRPQRPAPRIDHRAKRGGLRAHRVDDADARDGGLARRLQSRAARDADAGRSIGCDGAVGARGCAMVGRSRGDRGRAAPGAAIVSGTRFLGATSPDRRAFLGRVSSGGASLTSAAFVDALQLFEIGWSWGGVTSLAVPVNPPRTISEGRRAGALVRFNVGLEDSADLIADLEGVARACGMSEDRGAGRSDCQRGLRERALVQLRAVVRIQYRTWSRCSPWVTVSECAGPESTPA